MRALAKHGERVVGGLARVDHERLAVLLGEYDLAREGRCLGGTRRALTVVVEAALPHGDHRRVVEQGVEARADVLAPLLRAVRVQAGGGDDAGMGARETDRLFRQLRRVADADDALDTGRGRLRDGRVRAALEALQVRVGVDHAAGVSTRGKSCPPDVSTVRPLPLPITARSKPTSPAASPTAARMSGAREGRNGHSSTASARTPSASVASTSSSTATAPASVALRELPRRA